MEGTSERTELTAPPLFTTTSKKKLGVYLATWFFATGTIAIMWSVSPSFTEFWIGALTGLYACFMGIGMILLHQSTPPQRQ